jgi:1-acyl-sn-glycerol-3-phosphate acyltransferase
MPLPRPRSEQLELLTRFERLSFEVSDVFNRNTVLKSAGQLFLRTVGVNWVHLLTRQTAHLYGIENVKAMEPDRGVVLVCNHRSLADLFVVSCILMQHVNWVERLYFPVKSEFFYETVPGLIVNGLASAFAMYPPVMRRNEARMFNEYVLDATSALLADQGTVVGFHPEGTRNKDPNPYQLLPIRPGIGQMVHRARPIVVPVVILGVDDVARQAAHILFKTGEPITMTFGAPLDLTELFEQPARLRTYKAIGDRVGLELTKLLEIERENRVRDGLPKLF